MARVVAFIPDLLFGSSVLSALQAAGHQATLAGNRDAVAHALPGAELLIVDLTADPEERIEQVRRLAASELPKLAFYSHVEADVAARARDAGFALVVPRSRMAREGAALAGRLLSAG